MIRSMQAEDLEAVLDLWLKTNLQAHGFIPPRYWMDNCPAVRKMLPEAEVYVWEKDGSNQIEGFIGLTGSYIAGLFVRRESQSRGIGRGLLDHAKAIRPALTLSVYQKNDRAVRFYQREGFTIQASGTDRDTNQLEYTMGWTR